MKPILTFLFVLILAIAFIAGCKKDNGYSNAVITGYDPRMCACCGGLMINFNNEAQPFSGTFYDLTNTDSSLGINSSTTFPVYMKVKWQHNPSGCTGLITITSVERQ